MPAIVVATTTTTMTPTTTTASLSGSISVVVSGMAERCDKFQSHSLTHARTCSHAHALFICQMHKRTLTSSLFHCQAQTHVSPRSLSNTHTQTHALSLTNTHAHSLSLSQTQTHTCYLTLIQIHKYSPRQS